MYIFEKIEPTAEQWREIEGAYDSTCFQTEKWYAYLRRIGVKPFIVAIDWISGLEVSGLEDERIGYFCGEKMWLGVPMVTAPIEGIGTYTQGLNMLRETSEEERIEIYQALAEWVFQNGYAWTMQVEDWQLRKDSVEWIPYEEFHHETIEKYGLPYEFRPTLHVPVNKSEEDLWAGLHYKSCKYCVNKANKLGLEVREITKFEDIPAFCKEHYKQVKEVCEGHGQRPKPAQSEKRMRALCESLFPDRVMMIECMGKDENGVEQIMSTGIYCIDKGQCSYWTGASYKRYQKNCPNELMVWEAIKRLSARGAGDLNFCGIAPYKLKFGTVYAYVPRLRFAKYKILLNWTRKLKWMYHGMKKMIIDPMRKIG
jgi:hypothetical protein